MKAFVGNTWRDGFLDYDCPPEQYRIEVKAFLNLESLDDFYVQPKRNWRLVLNYVKAIGVSEVARKIVSRSRESFRNDKCFSVGVGTVLTGPADGTFAESDQVLFFAPCHPPCVERLTLPGSLLAGAADVQLPVQEGKIIYLPPPPTVEPEEKWWNEIRGWTPYSGTQLPTDMSALFKKSLSAVEQANWSQAQHLTSGTKVQSETPAAKSSSDKKSAVLFGYGQYAKTICLPNVQHGLDVCKIHEIDPMQLPANREKHTNGWSTRGEVNADDDYDVYLIAGFHHTHTSMAIKGLKKGAAVIVEKPIAVDSQQLEDLTSTLKETGGQLFSCLQKRYWRYNEWAREDLLLKDDTPVNYHCIIFELMLPDGHWYLWPNSGSRIISNGCHWLDHFLFMNNYAEPTSHAVHSTKNGTINCSVELENGAAFTMVLTDQGSPRIGVQEHIEMHTGGRSAKITQDAYVSESDDRILRKSKVHKFDNFHRMYNSIISRIESGEPGDSLRAIEVSTNLMLSLEAQFQQLTK